MKIHYFGTAAAEGIPALFCECPACMEARKTGGKNIRSRCQMLVNDDLLVDYPPDSYYHFVLNKVDLRKIHHILISHAHEDHFYPLDFAYFMSGFSHPKLGLPVTIHGSEDLEEKLNTVLKSERNQGLCYEKMEPYKEYQVGGYTVVPMKAEHGTPHPYIYLIHDGEKTLFYCHDSGLMVPETLSYLKGCRFHIDCASLDCTAGTWHIEYSCHMSVERNIVLMNQLKSFGIADEKTKVVLSHFSHNSGDTLYDDMVKAVKPYGFLVAYDGMELEF